MSRFRPLMTAAMAALALAFCAVPASAKTPGPISDCQSHGGNLSRSYSIAQLHAALKEINSTTREYTNCANAIQDQLDQKLGTTTGSLNGVKPSTQSGGGSGTVILIVVIVVVLLLGGGGAFWAYRRNQLGSGGPEA